VAVRVINACREMGIQTVAIYEPADRGSLHMRLGDESVLLETGLGYMDAEEVLRIAVQKGVDAVHPGYGFLAERPEFAGRCVQAGLTFIGTHLDEAGKKEQERAFCKLRALWRACDAGFPTVDFSHCTFMPEDVEASYSENGGAQSLPAGPLQAEAQRLGYPVVVKACSGGRGRGERLVWSPDKLVDATRSVQAQALRFSSDKRVYLEKAIVPSYLVGVQVVADRYGSRIHLGESQSLVQRDNSKIIEETPAPCLCPEQRLRIQETALAIAGFLGFEGVGKVEFLVDDAGEFHFTEIKTRLPLEHPLFEMQFQVDLVQEQIRIAAGDPLSLRQKVVEERGWAILCRVNAEAPCREFQPSPGHLEYVRLPGGPHVRIDTYVDSGCNVPVQYDPLVAKLTVWGENREACLGRLRRALGEYKLIGVTTNLGLLQRILVSPRFVEGSYASQFSSRACCSEGDCETHLRDLAVAASLLYLRNHQPIAPEIPKRLLSGWRHDERKLHQWKYGGLAHAPAGRNH
jgi:acetyl/propionyl-CoA carboxylase alpha subunit